MPTKRNKKDEEAQNAYNASQQRHISQFNQAIEEFVAQCGCSPDEINAQLWEFSPTHSAIVIKLSCPNSKQAIYLACQVTSEIHMQVQWQGASIRAELKDDMCEVTDSSGNLRIRCCVVAISNRPNYL